MEPRNFDALTRALASRRAVTRGLAAAAAIALGGRRAAPAVAATGQSFGCKKSDNSCVADALEGTPCPDAPTGICVIRKGKPLCVRSSDCYPCKKDADCHASHGAAAICVKCAYCKQLGPITSACVVRLQS